MANCDRLIVAGLEMQELMLFDRIPNVGQTAHPSR